MSMSFDATFYQNQRPDVYNAFIATAGSTGLSWAQFAQNHYNTFGRFEGSDPAAAFDTTYYLSTYPDVAAAGVNPFDHFLAFGASEGRFPTANVAGAGFDEATYLAANADVQAAVTAGTFTSGYQHWVLNGQFESRPGAPTVDNGGTGQTFNFTNSTITGTLDQLVGTSGDDTFNGLANNFVETGDSVDGGGGTDTINGRFTAANQTIDPTLSNIENVFVQVDDGNSTFTFDGADVSSQLWLKNTDTDNGEENTFSNVALTTTVGVEGGSANTDLTAAFAGATGSADSASIALNAGRLDTLTVANVETLNFVGSAGSSTLNTVTSTAATTVNVSGSGNVTLTDIDDVTTTFNAGTATGNVSVGGFGAVDVTATGGAGDDTINIGGTLTVDDTLDGGAGTDTLRVDDEDQLTEAGLGRASNFEALQVDVVNAVTTLDNDFISGVNTFIFGIPGTAGGTGIQSNTTISDGVTGATVTQYADAANAAAFTHNLKSDGSTDELTVNLVANDNSGGATTVVALTSLIADDPETLNINTSDNSANGADGSDTLTVATVTLSDTTTLNITGSEALQLGGTASTATNLATISAGTYTGDLDLGAVGQAFATANTGASITTGSGDDIVSLNVGNGGVLGATDLGSNTTVGNGNSATEGDLLALTSAAGTGLTIVDLTSTTDQISQLLGSANTAVQLNIEHIDISGFAAAGASSQITGTSGVNAITGGAGADTINAGAGNDVVDGNGGADSITLGAGVDTFNFTAGDSVVGTADTLTANVTAGDTITFGNGLDVIQDFSAGASGDLFNGANAGAPTTGIGVAHAAGFTAGTTYFLSGNFNSGTNVFTITADGAGADTLIIEGDGTDIGSANANQVVLVGVDSDDIVAANFI